MQDLRQKCTIKRLDRINISLGNIWLLKFLKNTLFFKENCFIFHFFFQNCLYNPGSGSKLGQNPGSGIQIQCIWIHHTALESKGRVSNLSQIVFLTLHLLPHLGHQMLAILVLLDHLLPFDRHLLEPLQQSG